MGICASHEPTIENEHKDNEIENEHKDKGIENEQKDKKIENNTNDNDEVNYDPLDDKDIAIHFENIYRQYKKSIMKKEKNDEKHDEKNDEIDEKSEIKDNEINKDEDERIIYSICYKNQDWLDWDSLCSRCFANIEQEIGNFIKDENKQQAIKQVIEDIKNKKSSDDKLAEFAKQLKQEVKGLGKWNHKIIEKIWKTLHKMLTQFVVELFIDIYEITYKVHKIILSGEELYDIIRSLPILNLILPKETDRSSVLPPESGFYNWSLTIQYKTDYLPFLQSIDDVIKFISKSVQDGKKCRFVSYGHSFSPMFGDDNTYTGKIIQDEFTGIHPPYDGFKNITKYSADANKVHIDNCPLMFIEKLSHNQIKVGGATSNIIYSEWQKHCWFNMNHKNTPSEPCNVLQHYQGYGGTHSVGCHGSGINTTNLPYYIKEMRIIDAFGKEHVYKDEKDLKIMSTHFGLLGFVKEMTLQYDEQYFALFEPRYEAFDKYFPPTGDCIDFENDVKTSHYNEFFWWPLNQPESVYVNCWKRTNDGHDVEDLNTDERKAFDIMSESIMQSLSEIMPYTDTKGLGAYVFQQLISSFGQLALPTKKKKVLSSEAVHFRWGIQNMRVLDMEWSIPLKAKIDKHGNKYPDVTRARDLWRKCRELIEQEARESNYPQLLPLEMRIVRGNDYYLTAGYNIDFSCTIEVLTLVGSEHANRQFYKYCQKLTDAWADLLGDDVKYMRPHWGKIWQNFTVKGKDIYEHLRETYKEGFQKFNAYRLKHDPNGIFMNSSFEKIFKDL